MFNIIDIFQRIATDLIRSETLLVLSVLSVQDKNFSNAYFQFLSSMPLGHNFLSNLSLWAKWRLCFQNEVIGFYCYALVRGLVSDDK
jgi:hypothetical protein